MAWRQSDDRGILFVPFHPRAPHVHPLLLGYILSSQVHSLFPGACFPGWSGEDCWVFVEEFQNSRTEMLFENRSLSHASRTLFSAH